MNDGVFIVAANFTDRLVTLTLSREKGFSQAVGMTPEAADDLAAQLTQAALALKVPA
jgi:hypothetical protein